MFSDLYQSFLLPYLLRDVRSYLTFVVTTLPPINENKTLGGVLAADISPSDARYFQSTRMGG